jgi:hypothetical protein
VKIKNAVVAGVLALLLGNAQAGLFARGGGLLYDDVLNITWLSDANYAKTSGYDADGLMSWTGANAWAAGLNYGGYSDWRLSTALNQDGSGPCFAYFCSNSEMGHMFYNNMGGSAGNSILTGTNVGNLALVTNLQSYRYWSGTAYAPLPTRYAWLINYNDGGFQDYFPLHTGYQYDEYYAWAVRDGDVAAPVPEPETYAMMLAGLGLLGVLARRRKQTQQ